MQSKPSSAITIEWMDAFCERVPDWSWFLSRGTGFIAKHNSYCKRFRVNIACKRRK